MTIKTKEKVKRKIKGITGVGFEFMEDGHAYYLDGVRLTGVTTILGIIAKPVLIGWAAGEVTKYIQEHAPQDNDGVYLVDDNCLQEAKVAHRKKKEDAGDKGKEVHATIESIIKDALQNSKGVIVPENISDAVKVNDQVRHFISWSIENRVTFLASEERIFSRELWMGGTIDFICEIDGEPWIGDIKTSSAVYPEHFFQTAGYQKLMEDMALTDGGMQLNIKGHVILNCRKDGSFEEKRSISNEDNRKAFLSAYELYRISEKLKGTII